MGQAVGEIMSIRVVALSGEDTVRDAARQMRERNVGAVLVHRQGELCGIVTDRDLVVRCLARNGDCDETQLREVCSPEVFALHPDDDVDHAVNLMREKKVRRVPVVKNGKPVGILSLGDLAMERDPYSALGTISRASPNS
jgi:CBS domain-containing protein